ncbi:MAG: hypothetical protein RSB71_02670 [Bacilli bacterium]
MKEIRLDIGSLKVNRNLMLAASGTFVLLGGLFATGTIGNVTGATSYFAGGLLTLNGVIAGGMAYNCHKKIKKM